MNHIGQTGEDLANHYLIRKGYQVLDKNFKVPFGEIDIIAEKGDVVCFVEVKCRKSKKYGLPEEAITRYKKNKIIKVAQFYINKKQFKKKIFRFDVISIQFEQNSLKKINHIINAFMA